MQLDMGTRKRTSALIIALEVRRFACSAVRDCQSHKWLGKCGDTGLGLTLTLTAAFDVLNDADLKLMASWRFPTFREKLGSSATMPFNCKAFVG